MATVQVESFDLETTQVQAKKGSFPASSPATIHKDVTPIMTRVKSDVKEKTAVHCSSPDTVIDDLRSRSHCDIDDMPEVSSKEDNQVNCWMCEVAHKKCGTCVFNDAKSGKDVDKTSLAEAIYTHENILGAYNMALIQKNVDTATEFRKILTVLQKMFMSLDMLIKMTDNTLKYTGNNGISALLHNYRVQLDVLLKNVGDVCNISLAAMNNH